MHQMALEAGGLYSLLLPSYVWFAACIVARMLNGLGGRFRLFKLRGVIEGCRPNPYGTVGPLESESIVTICGSGDATVDMKIISRVSSPDISVELRTIGVFVWVDFGHWMTVPHKTHQSQSNSVINWNPSLKVVNY